MPIVIKKEFHCSTCGHIQPLYENPTTLSLIVCLNCGDIFDTYGNEKLGESEIRGYTCYVV